MKAWPAVRLTPLPAVRVLALPVLALPVLVLMVLVLAACGSAGPATSASSSSASSPSGPGATAPASAGQNGSAGTPSGGTGPAGALPAVAHTVIVVMENHSYGEVVGSSLAPYIDQLAAAGALFTNSRAVAHPSEPNYLALFSGSTQGVTSDSCPATVGAANLASQLIAAHRTFTGYAESVAPQGAAVCSSGEYARKHVPWADFSNVPPSVTKSFTSFPAGNYGRLPDVSFVIPNLCDDMHDCSVATGDGWLKRNLGGYVTWAKAHDSLLILTWDENDGSVGNQIPTIFVGQMVRPGRFAMPITHYSVLHTVETLYGLRPVANAAAAPVINAIWR